MALCEGFLVSRPSLQALVALHRGNLARSILALNYWTTSQGGNVSTAETKAGELSTSSSNEKSWQEIEQLVLHSGKQRGVLVDIQPMTDCSLPFVGVDELNAEKIRSDGSMLKTIFENGFADLFNFNMIDLLPLDISGSDLSNVAGNETHRRHFRVVESVRAEFSRSSCTTQTQ